MGTRSRPRRAPIPRQLCGLKDWFPLDALPFDQTWDPSVVLQRRRTGRTNCSERQSGEIFSRGAPCIDVLRHLVALTWPTTAGSDEGLQSRDVTVWYPTSRKKPHPTCEAWNEQDINGRLSRRSASVAERGRLAIARFWVANARLWSQEPGGQTAPASLVRTAPRKMHGHPGSVAPVTGTFAGPAVADQLPLCCLLPATVR